MANDRVFGLDVVRAVAISLVLLSHFVGGLNVLGVYGVELFFILSGFLIGSILLKTVYTKEGFAFRDLVEFLRRRWYRTLPNYYLFLFLYTVFQVTCDYNSPSLESVLTFGVFLQNFAWPIPFVPFGISWSLSVEEWFYLLSASSLFLMMGVFPISKSRINLYATLVIGFFILGPILLRLAIRDKIQDMRTVVVFRFDAIMYGVLMALVRIRFPYVWGHPLLLAIGASSFLLGAIIIGESNASTAIALSLIPLGFANLLPLFIRISKPKHRTSKWIECISVWSYSMYLSHILIILLLQSMFDYNNLCWLTKLAIKILAASLIIVISALNYIYFEKPMTDLRNRTLKSVPLLSKASN